MLEPAAGGASALVSSVAAALQPDTARAAQAPARRSLTRITIPPLWFLNRLSGYGRLRPQVAGAGEPDPAHGVTLAEWEPESGVAF